VCVVCGAVCGAVDVSHWKRSYGKFHLAMDFSYVACQEKIYNGDDGVLRFCL
jgi:hypothetical protein